MVGMNKLKYWILVTAALVKVFTPSILMFGSALVFNGTLVGDAMFILGICSLGWITDINFPQKPE
jgi:hypothetical protein